MIEIVRSLEDMRRRLARLETLEGTPTEGTWTPTYTGGTTAGTTTYSKQVGRYIRIGDAVLWTAYVVWTAATGTGDARVSLPHTTAATTDLRATASVWTWSTTWAFAGVQSGPQALILPGTNYVYFWTPQNNAGSATIQVEADGEIVVSGLYFV